MINSVCRVWNVGVTHTWGVRAIVCAMALVNLIGTDTSFAKAAYPSLQLPNCLMAGQVLHLGDSITSPDGSHQLQLTRLGSLILTSKGNMTWSTGTTGMDIALAAMQGDGNFVLYNSNWDAAWSSGTAGNNGAYLKVQNDGNLVIYPFSDPVTTPDSDNWPNAKWSSGTYNK